MEKVIERQGFENYLDNLEKPPIGLSQDFAKHVRTIWHSLQQAVGQELKVPIAGPGGEFGFVFSWTSLDFCLQIDMGPNEEFEWSFHSRKKVSTNCTAITSSDGSNYDNVKEPVVYDYDLWQERLIRLLTDYCCWR